MEYVDGEDLAALLARIGRLSKTKALELAHELCAGLAAAHAKNVVTET
jgi:serine/threonine-protein kinase